MNVRARQRSGLTGLLFLGSSACALAVNRFPKPDFEVTNHEVPTPTYPNPSPEIWDRLDVIVLVAMLSLTAWLVHKKRSRSWVFGAMIVSLLYFGFYRKGCICPVGAIQNVSMALTDSTYVIPVTVIFLFVLPLLFALFFGRVFCAAVCPLGAIQDAVVIKNSLRLPRWLQSFLTLLPYLYLGIAVLFAANGIGFLICRYDPFVGFFRRSGYGNIMIFGGFLLVLGVVIARPYCRFLCPYGVLLNWLSRFSRRRVSITPAECIQCKLCGNACPFDAIDRPELEPEDTRERGRKRLTTLLLFGPAILLIFGGIGWMTGPAFSTLHPRVKLASQLRVVLAGDKDAATDETRAFMAAGKMTADELFTETRAIRSKVQRHSAVLGVFLGLVIALRLFGLSVFRSRDDYEANAGACLACARCFPYCPVDRPVPVESPPNNDQSGT